MKTELKAQDLRIGNWLNYELGRFQVRGTGKDCVWLNDMGGPILLNGFMNIQPIPLTEEILLKCGFDTNNFNDIWFYKSTDYTLRFENQIVGFYYDESELKTPMLYVEYLHQLQNLYFALTGEELTINLKYDTTTTSQ